MTEFLLMQNALPHLYRALEGPITRKKCPRCNGTGLEAKSCDENEPIERCLDCDGTGMAAITNPAER